MLNNMNNKTKSLYFAKSTQRVFRQFVRCDASYLLNSKTGQAISYVRQCFEIWENEYRQNPVETLGKQGLPDRRQPEQIHDGKIAAPQTTKTQTRMHLRFLKQKMAFFCFAQQPFDQHYHQLPTHKTYYVTDNNLSIN